MSEEKDVIVDAEPHGEGEKDYRAMYEQAVTESRKWETRSKANAEKAKAYDALAQANQDLEERVKDLDTRYKALETEKRELETEKARAALVASVAKATGVPESIVSTLSATDEDELTQQASKIAEAFKVPGGAPTVPEAGKFSKEEQGISDERKFARELFSAK